MTPIPDPYREAILNPGPRCEHTFGSDQRCVKTADHTDTHVSFGSNLVHVWDLFRASRGRVA